jgi:azurin
LVAWVKSTILNFLNYKIMKRIALSLSAMFLMVACGGGEAPATETETTQESTEQATPEATSEDNVTEEAQAVTLDLAAVGETMATMAYEPTRLEVPAGAEVTVNLMSKATAEAMIHNVVFIERGAQEEVSMAGLEAGKENNFVPADNEKIVAYTEIAQPGETKSVTFTAPAEAGTYQFICTYPGHTAMKGILLVK